jgi:hypothetical protein
MNHTAPVVESVGLACGCAVVLAAVLLLTWWLWSRFARPHGRHASIGDSASNIQTRNTDAAAPMEPKQLEGASW